MTYAHITDDTIQTVGRLPKSARRLDSGDWVLGLANAPAKLRKATGWHEVADVARPEDTPTTTHDRTIELVAGVPTVVWTERDLTDEEIAARDAPTREDIEDAFAAAIADAWNLEEVRQAAADRATALAALEA